MKKRISVLLLLTAMMLSMTAQTNAPAVSEEKNVIKINTLSLLIGTGSMFYERRLSENTSAQMGVGYLNYSFSGDAKFTGLFLTPEFRYYPKGRAIDGMYVAPYVRYQRFDYEDDDTKGNYTNLGGGALIGRQWILDSGFTMDLFFGGHYGKGTVSNENDNIDTNLFEGFRMRFGFAIGFGF